MPNLLTQRRILRPWRPDQIQGLSLWLDGADASTITLSGTSITQWGDKSGNQRHATQGTGSAQPSYSSSGQINGITCPTFDGTNDFMTTASFTLNQPTTMFLVLRKSTTDATERFFVDGTTNRNALFWNSSKVTYFAGTVQNSTAVLTANVAATISAIFNGASSGLWLNGTSISTANPGTQGISGGMRIGTYNNANTYFFDGQIGEFLIYSGSLESPARRQIESYLRTKWGTP